MKITTVSTNELELKEGGTAGIVAGAALVVAGVFIGLYLHGSSPVVVWVALAMGAGGISAILFSSSITVNANKATGQLRYHKKRLVGAQDATYAIADVFRIETRKQWRLENTPSSGGQNANMQQPVLVAQSVIVFKDGREVPLDHQKTSSTTSIGSTVLMGGQGAETAMAAQVARFLNVPFEEIMPPNMSAGINIIDGPGGALF